MCRQVNVPKYETHMLSVQRIAFLSLDREGVVCM